MPLFLFRGLRVFVASEEHTVVTAIGTNRQTTNACYDLIVGVVASKTKYANHHWITALQENFLGKQRVLSTIQAWLDHYFERKHANIYRQ